MGAAWTGSRPRGPGPYLVLKESARGEKATAYGPFDLAFLPINGFRQTLGRTARVPAPMSLTPEQAVEVAQILGARRVVPIHYGNAGQGYAEVPDAIGAFVRAAKAAGLPHTVLAPGATLD
jgi:L-ascorbate metabolism protein UlaG (beta-lactamase superfamily)